VVSLAVDLPVQAEAITQVPETKGIYLAEGEGFEHSPCRISNLLILDKILSPHVPANPHRCLQDRLQESPSLGPESAGPQFARDPSRARDDTRVASNPPFRPLGCTKNVAALVAVPAAREPHPAACPGKRLPINDAKV
jgi:hypothetical protein